ncbi:MAG: hypothetical protein SXV54_20400 [Chloroflexota bacterium]|nr:hypothetical protein [Chloroflexota bacterium]
MLVRKNEHYDWSAKVAGLQKVMASFRNYPATPPNSKPDDVELALTPSPSPPPLNPPQSFDLAQGRLWGVSGRGGQGVRGVGTGQSIRATAQAGAAWA